MQTRTPNPCGLIGPKCTVLIDQNRVALAGGAAQLPIEWGKPPSYWLKQDPGTAVWIAWQEHGAGRQFRAEPGSPVQFPPGSAISMRPLCGNGRLGCCFSLNPVSQQESFLVGAFFLRVHSGNLHHSPSQCGLSAPAYTVPGLLCLCLHTSSTSRGLIVCPFPFNRS